MSLASYRLVEVYTFYIITNLDQVGSQMDGFSFAAVLLLSTLSFVFLLLCIFISLSLFLYFEFFTCSRCSIPGK